MNLIEGKSRMPINLEGQVALITGAGTGLGRAHALELARLGAHVIINDLPPGKHDITALCPAELVVKEIEQLGRRASVAYCDVSDEDAARDMVGRIIRNHGRIDILINNAGILRDKSFAKSSSQDFRRILEVHLMGSFHCSHAVWPHMVEQGYGRILMTTSASGIYGNFGQSNYGAAKAAVVGLMNVLAIEGEAKNIRVNSLAPTAATQMTQDLLDSQTLEQISADSVSPAAAFLVSPEAPTKCILAAGGGVFATAQILESEGVYLPAQLRTPDRIADLFDDIDNVAHTVKTGSAFEQTRRYVAKAQDAALRTEAVL